MKSIHESCTRPDGLTDSHDEITNVAEGELVFTVALSRQKTFLDLCKTMVQKQMTKQVCTRKE